jgi:hypothetical protein
MLSITLLTKGMLLCSSVLIVLAPFSLFAAHLVAADTCSNITPQPIGIDLAPGVMHVFFRSLNLQYLT